MDLDLCLRSARGSVRDKNGCGHGQSVVAARGSRRRAAGSRQQAADSRQQAGGRKHNCLRGLNGGPVGSVFPRGPTSDKTQLLEFSREVFWGVWR